MISFLFYFVQFKVCIVDKVMAEEIKIVVSEAHHEDMHEPKTKAEYLSAMKHMMDGMHKEKKDTLMAMYNGMKKSAEMAHGDKEEETKEKKEAIEKRVKSVDVKEHRLVFYIDLKGSRFMLFQQVTCAGVATELQ